MITIEELEKNNYKKFTSQVYSSADILYQKRFYVAHKTKYFINVWVYNKGDNYSLDFELCTETKKGFTCSHHIYAIPDNITLKELEDSLVAYWKVDGVFYD